MIVFSMSSNLFMFNVTMEDFYFTRKILDGKSVSFFISLSSPLIVFAAAILNPFSFLLLYFYKIPFNFFLHDDTFGNTYVAQHIPDIHNLIWTFILSQRWLVWILCYIGSYQWWFSCIRLQNQKKYFVGNVKILL